MPRLDFFDDHAFLVASMIDDAAAGRYEQVAIFFGKTFAVTFQEREGEPFEPVRRRIELSQPSRLRTRSADYLAYALLDALVDSYFPILERAGDRIEQMEDEILAGVHRQQHTTVTRRRLR